MADVRKLELLVTATDNTGPALTSVNKRIKATSTEIEATKKHADRLGTALGVTGAAVVAATTLFVKASVNLGAELGRLISAKVVETLRNEMRPGGLMGVRGRS